MKISEANKRLKNKIAEVSIPGCPVSKVQVGDGWMKIQFRGNDRKTFQLRPGDPSSQSYRESLGDFVAPDGAAQKIREVAGRKRKVAIVRRPKEDELKLGAAMAEKLQLVMNEMTRVLGGENAPKKIIDTYGLNCDFTAVYEPLVPKGAEKVKIKSGTYYYLGRYDAARGAELWAPAMEPPAFASRMLGSKKRMDEEQSIEGDPLDEADCPFPQFDPEDQEDGY